MKKIDLEEKPAVLDSDPELADSKYEENRIPPDPAMKKIIAAVYVFLILFGVATGFMLARGSGRSPGTSSPTAATEENAVGIEDTTVFKDSATGTVEAGGMDGEGTHQLIREGGPSQTVYLTSSVVDLDEFIGKEVTVWGQTMGAQKAGWLMDVGKVVPK